MSGWEDLIGRLTQRLEVDEELRLDVARELRCHLEDSAAEFLTAGQSDAEAAASAAKALGDEEELADQLWQANRGRIRLRGVLRWTARVALLPAAVLVVLSLGAYLIGVQAYYQRFLGEMGAVYVGPPLTLGRLTDLVCDPYLGVHLTADQRWLRSGDPNARGPVAVAKSISDRWPENPVYYANYMAQVLNQGRGVWSGGRGTAPAVDEQRLGEVLVVLRHGEQVDPSNGIYDALIAGIFIDTSTVVKEDPSATYESVPGRGRSRSVAVMQVEITDADGFAEGLAEFREALAKPLLKGRSLEMLSRRVAVLPRPVRMIQYLDRVQLSMETQLPPLWGLRQMSEALSARARGLAHQGHRHEAEGLLRDVERLAAKLGAQGETLVDLLVAWNIYCTALGYEEVMDREAGRAGLAEQARQKTLNLWDLLERVSEGRKSFDGDMERQLGLLERFTVPRLPGVASDMRPVGTAELFIVGETGLLALLALLLLVAVVVGAEAVPSLLFAPRPERPVLLFVGWRRLGRIILLAVVVPLVLYGAYGVVSALAAPGLGLFGIWDRLAAELALVCWVIVILIVRLSSVAVQQRAAELGMEVPARPPHAAPWGVAVLAALSVGLVGYVVFWWASQGRTRPFDWHILLWLGALLAATVAAMLPVAWLARRIRGVGGRSAGAGRPQATWQVPRALRAIWRLAVAIVVMAAAVWVEEWAWEASIPRGELVENEPWLIVMLAAFYAILILAAGWLFCWVLSSGATQRAGTVTDRRFRQTLRRSMVPILAAAVIAVGVCLGGLLTVGESYAISRMGNTVPFLEELTHSDWRLLREHFVELDKAFQAQEAAPDSSAAR